MKARPTVDLDVARQARASLAKIAKDFPELRTRSSRGNRTLWEDALEDMMAKEKKAKGEGGAEQDEQLVVRLPKSLLERVDSYAERLRHEQPGPAWRRSDVVRLLLARALDGASEKPKRRA